MPKSLHDESLSEHVNLCRGQFISSFFWISGLDLYPFQMSLVICLEAHIQRSAISIVFFKCVFLENRPIEFDETFFAEKLKFCSFWNGEACLWSLKLIMGSPSLPFSTGVQNIFRRDFFFLTKKVRGEKDRKGVLCIRASFFSMEPIRFGKITGKGKKGIYPDQQTTVRNSFKNWPLLNWDSTLLW